MPEFNKETILSGSFMKDFDSYTEDSILFREQFLTASDFIESKKGIKTSYGKIIETQKDIGTGTTKRSGLLAADGSICEIFTDSMDFESAYINALNYYAYRLEDNIKLYSMLIPTQLEFKNEMYSNVQDSQKKAIDYIYSHLNERTETVDVYSALDRHKSEYIYFRTDHHWTALGAYYAYAKFTDVSQKSCVNKDGFEKNEINGFLGYLYRQANGNDTDVNPDSIEWYDVNKNNNITLTMTGFKDGKESKYKGNLFSRDKTDYSFFLGGDHPIADIQNSKNPDGDTILIIKDSYANAFLPWITNSYKRVVAVDPRTCKKSMDDIIDEYKPDEVLIMNYIFTATFEDYCDMLINLWK